MSETIPVKSQVVTASDAIHEAIITELQTGIAADTQIIEGHLTTAGEVLHAQRANPSMVEEFGPAAELYGNAAVYAGLRGKIGKTVMYAFFSTMDAALDPASRQQEGGAEYVRQKARLGVMAGILAVRSHIPLVRPESNRAFAQNLLTERSNALPLLPE